MQISEANQITILHGGFYRCNDVWGSIATVRTEPHGLAAWLNNSRTRQINCSARTHLKIECVPEDLRVIGELANDAALRR